MMDLKKYNYGRICEFAIYDQDGYIIGVKEDAPEDVKKAYAKLEADYNSALENGVKL
jgi:hypothetical protein